MRDQNSNNNNRPIRFS